MDEESDGKLLHGGGGPGGDICNAHMVLEHIIKSQREVGVKRNFVLNMFLGS